MSRGETVKSLSEAKKREYLERVLEIEHGSFTPLVFGTNGGMGKECTKFIKTLANQLSVKENETYAAVITWLRTRLSFEILRSAILCVSPIYTVIQIEFDFMIRLIRSCKHQNRYVFFMIQLV